MFGHSHLFKNFPQFVVICTVTGFSIVNEPEVDVFLEFLSFFCDPADGQGGLACCGSWRHKELDMTEQLN